MEPVKVGAELHLVIADLCADKDTVAILKGLQQGFPFPTTHTHRGVHTLLGADNQEIVASALQAMHSGDSAALGALMTRALASMDKWGAPACPEQLNAPILHATVAHEEVVPLVLGSKGVGSNGDGAVQFLCQDAPTAAKLVAVLRDTLHLSPMTLTIPPC